MARSDRWTALKKTPEYYSDFLNNFDLNPQTGYLAMASNGQAVANSIRNLVLTNKFERFYQPHVGSKVQSLLFDMNDIPTQQLLIDTILETIKSYEPRAQNPIVKIAQIIDADQVLITVIFSIVNIIQPFSFNLILKRVR